jgi:hypothetical protein
MSNTPVFSADERVDPPSGSLPAELQGKSTEEVAAYYQKKLREQQQAAPPPQTRMPSNSEFWQDPRKAAEDVARSVMAQGQGDAKAVTKQTFAELAEPIKQNLIDMAEYLTSQEFPDWVTHREAVRAAMAQVEPWARTQKHMWRTTYFYVKGVEASKPVAGTPPAGSSPPNEASPGGRSVIIPGGGPEAGRTPGSPGQDQQVTLTTDQQFVADHMGISPQQYAKAQKDIAEGNFPFTYDNRRGGRR